MFSLHIDTGRLWRGGQRQTLYLALGLRSMGHRAALVAHPDGELLRRMSEGLDLVPMAPARDIDLASAWDLSRVIRQLKPDVVHAHDPRDLALASMALSIASPVPRPALVASRRLDLRPGHNSFARWTEGEVDCFIANCAAIRDRLVAEGAPADRTVIVHESVDVDRVAHMPTANVHGEFYLPVGAPLVGNVAVLMPQKGHQHLIDAAALVVREVPDVRFVIVGDGDLRGALEERVRHAHLERHVFLAGFRDDALELTKGFDLFVVSSVSEGVCGPLLDAMAAGKAAVATAVGGIPEVMEDTVTGALVAPRDHVAMAQAIVRLLHDDRTRQRMGAAALARVRDQFTIEAMAAQTAAVYDRLLAGRDAGPG